MWELLLAKRKTSPNVYFGYILFYSIHQQWILISIHLLSIVANGHICQMRSGYFGGTHLNSSRSLFLAWQPSQITLQMLPLHRWQHCTHMHTETLIGLCLTESVAMNHSALPQLFRLNFLKIACPFERREAWFSLFSWSRWVWWDVSIVQQMPWHRGLTTCGCF